MGIYESPTMMSLDEIQEGYGVGVVCTCGICQASHAVVWSEVLGAFVLALAVHVAIAHNMLIATILAWPGASLVQKWPCNTEGVNKYFDKKYLQL